MDIPEKNPPYYEKYDGELKELDEGKFVKCIVHGRSMKTFFRPGKDYLVLAPIKNAIPASPKEEKIIRRHKSQTEKKKRNSSSSKERLTIRKRDIVLFKYRDTETYRLLRVAHIWGTLLLLRGDACYGSYECATVSDVAGIAVNGTFLGGCKFNATSFIWRILSKIWALSYCFRLWTLKLFKALPAMILTGLMLFLLPSCRENKIITVRDGQFIKNEKPYYFIGTNLWYGAILGSKGEGGNRERLCRELDSLHNLGLKNLRILVGAEGKEGVTDKIEPVLQKRAGDYDSELLEGLDYLLTELDKRDMEAVLYLNNAWEWSGGFSQYLEWAGYGRALIPSVDGYDKYVEYVGNFQKSDSAKAMFANHLKFIVSRKNTISGIDYKDDPAIFSWQICNEPRPFGEENKEAFLQWISECSSLIKSIDPNHPVSVGSEGKYGCENDIELWRKIGALKNVDYLNIHIWPMNWGWVKADNMFEQFDDALSKSEEYLNEHVEIAKKLNKPLVIEEFGFPRDNKNFLLKTPVTLRDKYYEFMFDRFIENGIKKGIVAGCNFWGWGGYAMPRHIKWEKGEDYTGDPAQEEQGLYSVFASDTSTISIIRNKIKKLNSYNHPGRFNVL